MTAATAIRPAQSVPGVAGACFVGSARLDGHAFRTPHPLAIPRIAALTDLLTRLGWLQADEFRASPEASADCLAGFHSRDYIDALKRADAAQHVPATLRQRHGLGTFENPVFPGVYRKAATAVGGSILAAELALAGSTSFHPAGGTHHGRPDRASGFCYFNDPVFAIRRLLQLGVERVAYVDLDAHHCDGVQHACAGDPRVFTISIHEAGRWPGTGALEDRGGGRSFNLPVPRGLNDTEFRYLLDEAILPLAAAAAPEALVVTCGTDALAGDPLTAMQLSNRALWQAVDDLRALAPTAVLGGGGYNPWTLLRCWSGLWARLSGREVPESLPPAAREVLSTLHCDLIDEDDVDPAWMTTLADAPRHGSIRTEVRAIAAAIRA